MDVAKKLSASKKSVKTATMKENSSAKARLSSPALENSIGYSLKRAQLSTHINFSSAMQPFEIRPSEFAVLMLIRSHPGLTQSAICNALGIQKTNFVALLDKLESRHITERRKVGGDRRSSALHLTPQGKAFVAAIEIAHQKMETTVSKRLGSKRTQELLTLLKEFTDNAASTAR